ncbi:MAG: PIN domain-containing protein [Phycicoccus sp.]
MTAPTTERFADTDVLLHAISDDPEERRKAEIARALLDDAELAVSVQVLQEFYVQATRPSRPNPPQHGDAASLVESFTRFAVGVVTTEVMRAAMATRARYDISSRDAAIIEAARSMGCTTVLSEDLADGQDYGGVRVVNPFSAAR